MQGRHCIESVEFMNTVLDDIYSKLDFCSGALRDAALFPVFGENDQDWLEKGEWLAAGKRAGAEKIFFVNNNPVVVFATSEDNTDAKAKLFNSVWCLGRPRLLFLSTPTELSIYDLAKPPVNMSSSKRTTRLKSLETIKLASEVLSRLSQFNREQIESGKTFADKRFGNISGRADRSLIRDLKTVRRELIDAGLSGNKVRFAHALIGRSIFIRYLEDRGVLTRKYFENIAQRNTEWVELLTLPNDNDGGVYSGKDVLYPKVLNSIEFTYALYAQLFIDFNGDLFPNIEFEKKIVTQRHINLIRDLLYGDTGIQKKLCFYCYDFNVVPLDLISSIYEEFYHLPSGKTNKKAKEDGAFYTPNALVEFVLSRILTPQVLSTNPRIIDPACGSGIFLVESFRRIVRFQLVTKRRRLTFVELTTILKNQISGIEINEEAARITVFSLYLAMLHYLDPPAIIDYINNKNTLPHLIASRENRANEYNTIFWGNAFDEETIKSNPEWINKFGQECADIVVGNPPWGAPGPNADKATRERHKTVLEWCSFHKKPIGDNEPSQAFLWRSLDLLKTGGFCSLLVSVGVLFKHSTTTTEFREKWFSEANVSEIYNFSHVRRFFFQNVVSPFISIIFSKGTPRNKQVVYYSAKESLYINKLQAISFSNYDINLIDYSDSTFHWTWKTFWFGRVNDFRLIKYLKHAQPLVNLVDRKRSGQGFKEASKAYGVEKLTKFNKMLTVQSFSRYDPLRFEDLPPKVERFGVLDIYEGARLLVKRGIDESDSTAKGKIVARYEDRVFCFKNSVYGLKLKDTNHEAYKLVLGILLSSLSRYFLFHTSSNWGVWHHEIYLDELLQLPIVYDLSSATSKSIVKIVSKLLSLPGNNLEQALERSSDYSIIKKLEHELDMAVYKLYELDQARIDLIDDFCNITLPFLYSPLNKDGQMLVTSQKFSKFIEDYISIFCKRWKVYLEKNEEMRAEVHVEDLGSMIGVEFFPSDSSDPWDLIPQKDTWAYLLTQIKNNSFRNAGATNVFFENIVHSVSRNSIIVIKKNSLRFWTKSMAREDAETTLCKLMSILSQ